MKSDQPLGGRCHRCYSILAARKYVAVNHGYCRVESLETQSCRAALPGVRPWGTGSPCLHSAGLCRPGEEE